jgi:hypothetical protein
MEIRVNYAYERHPVADAQTRRKQMTHAEWSIRGIAVSALLVLGSITVSTVGAYAAREMARGTVSPFTGSLSDLVTVKLHIAGGLNVLGQIFDNGSVVMRNTASSKGKGPKLCGDTAMDCVFAPGLFLIGKTPVSGNEIAYGAILFPGDLSWERLPGPLAVSFRARGNVFLGVRSGIVGSEVVNASAGQEVYFDLAPQALSGGIGITITGITITHARSVDVPALYFASEECQKDAVERLLAGGAQVNARDGDGDSPLHEAAVAGCKAVAEVLLTHGGDVNAKDNAGLTPLHMVVLANDQQLGQLDVAEMLLTHGANVNAKDNHGHTPLHYAEKLTGREHVRDFLRQHGGDKL